MTTPIEHALGHRRRCTQHTTHSYHSVRTQEWTAKPSVHGRTNANSQAQRFYSTSEPTQQHRFATRGVRIQYPLRSPAASALQCILGMGRRTAHTGQLPVKWGSTCYSNLSVNLESHDSHESFATFRKPTLENNVLDNEACCQRQAVAAGLNFGASDVVTVQHPRVWVRWIVLGK
jgi:hypothetical protein